MSTVIETRPDIQWLAPSWTQAGDEPAIRIEPNGFTLNRAALNWVQSHHQGMSYILVGMSRDDQQVYLRRVGDSDYPRRVRVDGSVFQHWELGKTLADKNYAVGATLTFAETDDPDMIAAYIVKRGA